MKEKHLEHKESRGKKNEVEESDNVQILSEKKHNQHFDDAVVFANIVDSCYDPSYPLGRKKCQKMMYLFKRFNISRCLGLGSFPFSLSS